MPGGAGGKFSAGGRSGIRVVVAGDKGTGKSSLIAAAASENFPDNVPRVLPPTRLPADFYPDHVPITIIDTPSSIDNRIKLIEEFKKADVVVLTYACDQPLTQARLGSYWLPELRRLEVKAAVVVAGCKLDLRDEHQAVSLEQIMAPIMQKFREIETCIECSASTLIQVPDVFYYAQKAVLHPMGPLFDQEKQCLKPRCRRALQRIFNLCDHDMDGALDDTELNKFQVECFNTPLQPAEIVGIKRVVQERQPDGVNEIGLTVSGFHFLHTFFIEKGRVETTWAVLRKFGYNDYLELRDDILPVPKHSPDQSVELTGEAMEFLSGLFRFHDLDNDGALQFAELVELFQTAPESPWAEAPYKDAVERTTTGNLSLNGFLSEWAMMTRLDPQRSLANLLYVGYGRDPESALSIFRKRSIDRKKQQTERTVFQCFVFGPKKSGKSALLDSFLGRSYSERYAPTNGERFAANVVQQLGGTRKTLIMREIPEETVKKFLSNKESLAACDVAVFVYDSSDEYSWKKTRDMLMDVARRGEESGYGMPCLLVAAKDDLDPYPMSVQDSDMVCQELGIEVPVSLSMKMGDPNNLFLRIVSTAENPHLSIPETEAGRRRKYVRQMANSSLIFVSVSTAVVVAGLAAYRTYAARKNA